MEYDIEQKKQKWVGCRMSGKKKRRTHHNIQGKTEEKGLNDLLLPIIAAVLFLPFVTYLKVYSTGLGRYDFYPDRDLSYDFYCYYRSRCFLIVMAVSLIVLVFYLLLYRKECKSIKQFLPLGIFVLLSVLSTIFSIDQNLSLKGSVNSNQSLWVVLGYVLLLLYTYEMMRTEHDFKLLLIAFAIVAVLFCVIGFFQISGNDLLNFEWMQRLCMNQEEELLYLGKVKNTFSDSYVYLTLYNPNYASLVIAMGMSFCTGMLLTCERSAKKEQAVYGGCLTVFVVLLYFTFSRMGFVAAFFGILVGIGIKGVSKKSLKNLAVFFGLAIFVLVILDAAQGFKFYHRLTDEKVKEKLTDLVTDENGVHIFYKGQEETLTFENMNDKKDIFQGEGTAEVKQSEGEQFLVVNLCDQDWYFGFENDSYYYYNPFGNHQVLDHVERWNLHGLESFASGRGYFWSRILPKLKRHILIGSGIDTTIVAFPQDDYAGRLNYSKDLSMVCDRAHSGYLQMALEAGVLGLLCMLVFLAVVMKKMFVVYPKLISQKKQNIGNAGMALSVRMGYGSFLACLTFLVGLLTNDMTLFTMPFACVFGGMAMAGVHMNDAQDDAQDNKKDSILKTIVGK